MFTQYHTISLFHYLALSHLFRLIFTAFLHVSCSLAQLEYLTVPKICFVLLHLCAIILILLPRVPYTLSLPEEILSIQAQVPFPSLSSQLKWSLFSLNSLSSLFISHGIYFIMFCIMVCILVVSLPGGTFKFYLLFLFPIPHHVYSKSYLTSHPREVAMLELKETSCLFLSLYRWGSWGRNLAKVSHTPSEPSVQCSFICTVLLNCNCCSWDSMLEVLAWVDD